MIEKDETLCRIRVDGGPWMDDATWHATHGRYGGATPDRPFVWWSQGGRAVVPVEQPPVHDALPWWAVFVLAPRDAARLVVRAGVAPQRAEGPAAPDGGRPLPATLNKAAPTRVPGPYALTKGHPAPRSRDRIRTCDA